MKLALLSLLLAAAPAFAADAPKTEAPKAAAPKAEAKKAAPAAAKDSFKNDDERTIYTYGYLVAKNFAAFNLTPAEVKIVQTAIADSVSGAAPKVDVRFFQSRVKDLADKRAEAILVKEKEKGRVFAEKFVKENKPQAIPEGGWYLETKPGTGAAPSKTSVIKAHYRGTTVDGAEFDSSYSRGAPTEFGLDAVIKCWTNGITLMKAGGKAKLVCPSDAAYGDSGRPGIKPGATLIFDVELVEIVKP